MCSGLTEPLLWVGPAVRHNVRKHHQLFSDILFDRFFDFLPKLPNSRCQTVSSSTAVKSSLFSFRPDQNHHTDQSEPFIRNLRVVRVPENTSFRMDPRRVQGGIFVVLLFLLSKSNNPESYRPQIGSDCVPPARRRAGAQILLIN